MARVWYSETLHVKERLRQIEFGRNATLNSPHIMMSAHSLIQQAVDGIWVKGGGGVFGG